MTNEDPAVGRPYTDEEIREMSAGIPCLLDHRAMIPNPAPSKKYPDPVTEDQWNAIIEIIGMARNEGER